MIQSNISLETLPQSLQATRHALLSEVETLNDTDVNIRPRRDKWSIIQIMHHLHLVEQSITSALVYALQKREGKFVPFKDLQLTLDRTYKREAPQQMQPTETLMKKQHGIQLLEHSRQELLHTLHSIIDEKELCQNSLKHSIFQELSLYQWIQFLDLHEQRHLTQLKEAKHAILQR